MRKFAHIQILAVCVAVLGLLAMPANQAGAQEQENAADQFPDELWEFMVKAKYKHWAPWPGQDGGFYPGQAPHGAFLKMYINRKAASNPTNPPEQSIIVKENYDKTKEKLMAVTVMYRAQKDFDPENKDWYWVKYNADGSVAEKDGMPLAGKVQGCINCHGGAKGGDLIFANDKQE